MMSEWFKVVVDGEGEGGGVPRPESPQDIGPHDVWGKNHMQNNSWLFRRNRYTCTCSKHDSYGDSKKGDSPGIICSCK